MTRTVEEILKAHRNWYYDEDEDAARLIWSELEEQERADLSEANLSEANLSGADLSGADLRWANLREANLSRANLSEANLSEANLRWAYLSGADLSGADLSGADLSEANLRWADLSGADLSGADLSGTVLDNHLLELQREFCKACLPTKRGGRIVYRTATSRHIGGTKYTPGHTYIAPELSFDCATACHPGIYAASQDWSERTYPGIPLVKCYVRDGDWVISAKGAIRCKRLRVLEAVK